MRNALSIPLVRTKGWHLVSGWDCLCRELSITHFVYLWSEGRGVSLSWSNCLNDINEPK